MQTYYETENMFQKKKTAFRLELCNKEKNIMRCVIQVPLHL